MHQVEFRRFALTPTPPEFNPNLRSNPDNTAANAVRLLLSCRGPCGQRHDPLQHFRPRRHTPPTNPSPLCFPHTGSVDAIPINPPAGVEEAIDMLQSSSTTFICLPSPSPQSDAPLPACFNNLWVCYAPFYTRMSSPSGLQRSDFLSLGSGKTPWAPKDSWKVRAFILPFSQIETVRGSVRGFDFRGLKTIRTTSQKCLRTVCASLCRFLHGFPTLRCFPPQFLLPHRLLLVSYFFSNYF